jgi:hypothetical protein
MMIGGCPGLGGSGLAVTVFTSCADGVIGVVLPHAMATVGTRRRRAIAGVLLMTTPPDVGDAGSRLPGGYVV